MPHPLSPLTRQAIEDAAEILETHYAERMPQVDAAGRDVAHALLDLAREIRMNLVSPPASFVPGRSLAELSRASTLALMVVRAFDHDPDLVDAWELLSRATAAALGPKSRPETGLVYA